jgi:hypothetical protein
LNSREIVEMLIENMEREIEQGGIIPAAYIQPYAPLLLARRAVT